MIRASFESDYNNGCLPEILRRLSETNDEKSSGYGFDPYTERAKDRHGLSLGIDSPTNQQFVILSKEQKQRLAEEIAFEIWEPLPDDHLLCRFVTCWATTEADIAALDEALKRTLAANA